MCQDNRATFTCKVLPNTGHHYFFYPFPKDIIDRSGGPTGDLARVCRSNSAPWEPACRADGDGQPTRWVRTRYGHKGKRSNIGLWVAIETNFGNIKRGTFVSREEVLKEAVPDGAMANPTPYGMTQVTELFNMEDGRVYFSLSLPDMRNPGQLIRLVTIEVIWKRPVATIDVDLIVDFGNTRSVVLALEHNEDMGGTGGLAAICRSIHTLPRGNEYPDLVDPDSTDEKGETIVDSWFLLQEPQFSEWDYPPGSHKSKSHYNTAKEYTSETEEKEVPSGWFNGKKTETHTRYFCTERMPQMFVEISPAMMGAEAKEFFHNIDLTPGLNICMSSPKRYLWDHEPVTKKRGQLPWNINYNPWHENPPSNTTPMLSGQICRYIYPDCRLWDLDSPPLEDRDEMKRPKCFPAMPSYPRCTAMVWTALAVIENAYRQITSDNWCKGALAFANRRLRSINLTFPSGWIAQEKKYFKEAWEQAINIFTLAHMEHKELIKDLDRSICDGRPELHMELDEAVASQLPFVYSEVRRLKNANMWIRLYGRCDIPGDDSYNAWALRVMTVDIGGGTCDSAIVEYRNNMPGSSIDLFYKVLFRDCSSFAGDAVTKSIIEEVLLPSIFEARGLDEESRDADYFRNALKKPFSRVADKAKWQRITTLVLLPIVRKWFTDVAKEPSGIFKEEGGEPFRTVQDCGVDETAMNDFNQYMRAEGMAYDMLTLNDRLKYDPDKVNAVISEVLENGIEPLGKFISAYNVDLVTLSGKISEMPVVHELLCKRLPLRPQRIIRMGNFPAGDWYPIDSDGSGKIRDAKTVTAVGTALFVASNNHLMDATWAVRPESQYGSQEVVPTKNYWGLLKPGGAAGFDNGPMITAAEDSNANKVIKKRGGKTFQGSEMRVGQYIGRQKYYSSRSVPEQQYQLCWNGPEDKAPRSSVAVIIERCLNEEQDDDIRIRQAEFTDEADAAVCSPEDLELRLVTLPQEGFWMDEARFDVNFED